MYPATHRKPYPSDVSDEEWSLVVPYLTLMTEAAPQRDHALRELFNALRYVIRATLRLWPPSGILRFKGGSRPW
jgi:hypothetical protein